MGDAATEPTNFAQESGSAARPRSKRRHVPAANRAELERLKIQTAREIDEERAEAVEAGRPEEAPGIPPSLPAPPPPPLSPDVACAVVRPYVRTGLCALNLVGARFMGYFPLEKDAYEDTSDAATSELAALLPDGLLRHPVMKVLGFGLRFVARHLEIMIAGASTGAAVDEAKQAHAEGQPHA